MPIVLNLNSIARLIAKKLKIYFSRTAVPRMSSEKLVVVVLGPTGTGKSKLAVEIARRFRGEVISADSMQVYKGLDIITNKVSVEELRTGPIHHLLGHVDPLVETYTVVDFRNGALPILNRILEDGNLPVVVGGTNYYIESLLWDVLVGQNSTVSEDIVSGLDKSNESDIAERDLRKLSSKELHDLLKRLDPEMAKLIHPNDRRKILRSLQVFEQHGRPHSSILEEQHSLEGGSDLGGPLRYSNACMLWLQCERVVLEKRLDDRVDDMIARGLLVELDNFHTRYNEQRLRDGSEADYTRGIFQSIGFKEFHSYLMLPRLSRETPEGEKILREGADRQVPPIFALDATRLETWDEDVLNPAVEIVKSLLNGTEPLAKPLPVIGREKGAHTERRETVKCELCQVIVKGQDQWKSHLSSKKHRSLVRRSRLAESPQNQSDGCRVLCGKTKAAKHEENMND